MLNESANAAHIAVASTTSANIFKNKPSSSVAADWVWVTPRRAEHGDARRTAVEGGAMYQSTTVSYGPSAVDKSVRLAV